MIEKKIFPVLCEQNNRKTADPPNAKEHYQSFLRMENKKSLRAIINKYLLIN